MDDDDVDAMNAGRALHDWTELHSLQRACQSRACILGC